MSHYVWRVTSDAKVFVQARMSSSRFPGKVLAPFAGEPLIKRVIDRVEEVLPAENIVVLTSTDETDDPLVAYLNQSNINAFRGDLTNVFKRFQDALEEYPCEGFFRVCGDSPFLEPTLFEQALEIDSTGEYDLITSKHSTSMPVGKNVEYLSSRAFSEVSTENLSSTEKEHIVNHFYNNPNKYEIYNIKTPELSDLGDGFCVDEISDLRRLKKDVIEQGEDRSKYKYPF